MHSRPSVTVVIVTWNSSADIAECLESLLGQTFGPVSILVVDSNSSDGTPDLIEKQFPSVKVIRSDKNLGYCAGNRLGMGMCSADYTIVLNDDLALAPDAIETLTRYMEQRPIVALATPMVLMSWDTSVVNTAGNRVTFYGMPSARGKGKSPTRLNRSEAVAAISGCAFIVRNSLLGHIGGSFSEDFLRYKTGWHASLEDADLSLRAWIAGYEVHCVANAKAFHHYNQRPMGPERWASLEYGRHLLLLRCFERETLLRLLPLLFVLEIATLVYSAVRGTQWLAAKSAALKWVVIHRHEIAEMRRTVQNIRTVHDDQILWVLDDEAEFSASLGGGRCAQGLEKMLVRLGKLYRRLFLPKASIKGAHSALLETEK